jgi:uncharacterized RDD family membrane protein YckC
MHDSPSCGLLRRIAAMTYDGFILVALLFAATVPVVLIHGGAVEGSLLFTLYLLGVAFAFFGGFWCHGGQTLGMKAWRIRVQRYDGAALTWREAALRFVAAIGSWLPLGAGYLWALFDRHAQCWHDRLSATCLCVIDRG